MSTLPIALVVGGSSGLGYEIAKNLVSRYDVHITGRTDPTDERMRFHSLNLTGSAGQLQGSIHGLISKLPEISLLAYCAGAVQLGKIDSLSSMQIEDQVSVGIVAPALFAKELLLKQEKIDTLLVVTSTTQRIAREMEPMYAASKAGLGMLAKSLSLDARIGKTLVAGPGGMKTKFWDGTGTSMEGFLDPIKVAVQVLEQLEGDYRYRHIEIPRQTGVVTPVKE